MSGTLTRRAAIGGIGIASAVGALALASAGPVDAASPPADAWERELAAFRAIEAAHNRFDREVWAPAYEAERAQEAAAGNPAPIDGNAEAWRLYHARAREIGPLPKIMTDEVDDEMDRLQEVYLRAMDRLIEEVPAPHCGAVLLKLEWALARSECFEGIFDDHREAILADLRRLAEGGQA